jgi:HD-like signal output (HDOD) protein
MADETAGGTGEEETRGDEPTALLIMSSTAGKSEHVLAKFLTMNLEYRYGLDVERVTNVRHVRELLKEHKGLQAVCLIQGAPVSLNSTVPILSDSGRLPLFLLQPKRIAVDQQQQVTEKEVSGVHVCAWESAFSKEQTGLAATLARGMADAPIGGDPEARVRSRLRRLDSLPSLPTVIGRLMKLIQDPKATMSDLEVLLVSEPSIVLKLRQVANSAAVAGSSGREIEDLKEAITRLGMKKVGAIAQQIALINSMVKSDENGFDLRQYWGHSLACALVADKLHARLTLKEPIPFNDYWIAALLHDCGKAVLGFFFYDWFERLVDTMEDDDVSFAEAETQLGEGMVTHDRIGELVMQKAKMPEELTAAVALHHDPGDAPVPLTALVHVANLMSKEMGFSYHAGGEVKYSRPALKVLGLKRETVRELVEELQEPVGRELMDVLNQCLGSE